MPNIGSGFSIVNSSTVNGWKTTASDNAIEIWYNNFMGVSAYSGNQFIELNANMQSALYQDVVTTPGTKLIWGFAHRGRNGIETIDFEVGSPNGPYTKIGSYSDGTDKWGYYSGVYEVPVGQTTTRFYYSSKDPGGVGNFIDAIEFYTTEESKDSVFVKVNALPTVNLGKDTTICQGEKITLNAGTSSSYQWNDNSTFQTLEVSSAGLYKVTVTSANNCNAADSINVLYKNCNTDLIIEDTIVLCKGDSAIIHAKGVTTQKWFGNEAFVEINDSTIKVSPSASKSVFYLGQNASTKIGNNLVLNGNFEQGNTSFTSDYLSAANLGPAGTYAIVSNPNSVHGGFAACGDNTTGSGKMMVVNGNPVANSKVWCTTVNVKSNKLSTVVSIVIGTNVFLGNKDDVN